MAIDYGDRGKDLENTMRHGLSPILRAAGRRVGTRLCPKPCAAV